MLISNHKKQAGANQSLPVNKIFEAALKTAIEDRDLECAKKPSKCYTPSGLNCIRNMYYKRTQTPMDKDPKSYGDIGGADTGTRRHEAIQEVLIWMTKHHNRFLYVDVETYVKKRQEQGRCLQLVIQDKFGAEVQLWDRDRDVKFRCDGIIYDRQEKQFYLFEFKNQISFKAAGKQSVDKAHYCQVVTYCAELDLDAALVTYENRDTLELYVPEIYKVSAYDKQCLMNKIDECEHLVKFATVPAIPDNLSPSDCRFCNYRKTCKADGKEEKHNG